MPRSTTRRRKGHGEVIAPLSVSDKIDSLLKVLLATFPSKTELTDEEIENWHRDLSGYQVEAIEYAFDCFRRSGLFFPVPAQIIDLCQTWEPPLKYRPGCDAVCKERHGKGYDDADLLALWKLYAEWYPKPLEKKLSYEQRQDLIDELDRRKSVA